MRVIIDFEFSDQEREDITRYLRKRYGTTGLPKLATRVMVREFVEAGLDNQWTALSNELSGEETHELSRSA